MEIVLTHITTLRVVKYGNTVVLTHITTLRVVKYGNSTYTYNDIEEYQQKADQFLSTRHDCNNEIKQFSSTEHQRIVSLALGLQQ
jgi:hypothetical protein